MLAGLFAADFAFLAEERGHPGARLYAVLRRLDDRVCGLAGPSPGATPGLEDHAATNDLGRGTVGSGA